MNPFVQQMINHKINNLTPTKLHELAQQYDTPLTMQQARTITAILHEEQIDILDSVQRKRILGKISRQADPAISKKIKALLEVFQ